MINFFRTLLQRWVGASPSKQDIATSTQNLVPKPSALDNPTLEPVPFDENLLERARTQWSFGDWESLTSLSLNTIQLHPNRAKLALLIAAGHLQRGDTVPARQFLLRAQDWGCDRKLIAQVLISGAHNSLGRASALANQRPRALQHFQAAITIGLPSGELKLLSQARVSQQFYQLGLPPIADTLQSPLKSILAQPPTTESNTNLSLNDCPNFSEESYKFYQQLPQVDQFKFVLIDSKSLPRSGLHYLKKTFSEILEDNFSFCEWYQEPGCCKKMPCSLQGYAKHCQKTNNSRLRLIKSHDFEMKDPMYPPLSNLRRVILIRDPLFILTSWFTLEQMVNHSTDLKKVGINIEKIFLFHEVELMDSIYELIDERFLPPDEKTLTTWLIEKFNYITLFIEKWIRPAIENPQHHLHVVQYEQINTFISAVLTDLGDALPAKTLARIKHFQHAPEHNFQSRKNPFQTQSKRLSLYLSDNSDKFSETSRRIMENDRLGIFQSYRKP